MLHFLASLSIYSSSKSRFVRGACARIHLRSCVQHCVVKMSKHQLNGHSNSSKSGGGWAFDARDSGDEEDEFDFVKDGYVDSEDEKRGAEGAEGEEDDAEEEEDDHGVALSESKKRLATVRMDKAEQKLRETVKVDAYDNRSSDARSVFDRQDGEQLMSFSGGTKAGGEEEEDEESNVHPDDLWMLDASSSSSSRRVGGAAVIGSKRPHSSSSSGTAENGDRAKRARGSDGRAVSANQQKTMDMKQAHFLLIQQLEGEQEDVSQLLARVGKATNPTKQRKKKNVRTKPSTLSSSSSSSSFSSSSSSTGGAQQQPPQPDTAEAKRREEHKQKMFAMRLDRIMDAVSVLSSSGMVSVYGSNKQMLKYSLEKLQRQEQLVRQQQEEQRGQQQQQQPTNGAVSDARRQAAQELALTRRQEERQQQQQLQEPSNRHAAASQLAVERVNNASFLANLPRTPAERAVWQYCEELDDDGQGVPPLEGPFSSKQLVAWHAGGFFDDKKGYIGNCMLGPQQQWLPFPHENMISYFKNT